MWLVISVLALRILQYLSTRTLLRRLSYGCVIGNADLNVSDASGDPCLFYTLALLSSSSSGTAAATPGAAAPASTGAGTKRRLKRSTVSSLDSLPPTFEALHQVLLKGFELAPERPPAPPPAAAAAASSVSAPGPAAAAASSSQSQGPQPMDVDLELTAGSDAHAAGASASSSASASGAKVRRGSSASAGAASAAASSSGASGMLSGILSRIAGALSSAAGANRPNNTLGGAKNWGLAEPVPLAVLLAAYLIQHGADAHLHNRSHVCTIFANHTVFIFFMTKLYSRASKRIPN